MHLLTIGLTLSPASTAMPAPIASSYVYECKLTARIHTMAVGLDTILFSVTGLHYCANLQLYNCTLLTWGLPLVSTAMCMPVTRLWLQEYKITASVSASVPTVGSSSCCWPLFSPQCVYLQRASVTTRALQPSICIPPACYHSCLLWSLTSEPGVTIEDPNNHCNHCRPPQNSH